ncbi:iron ABC transporter permease [Merismopedia glauca CCAP 1448/3]|uniref:Iron ABC transporter permease n=2 Tax=Merismopedia TaxID=53402 RepID=A0A2T1C9W5_9CYAN|nr:iron ABC transporter permease [Merismopedia glauca CCAP 1448/3]
MKISSLWSRKGNQPPWVLLVAAGIVAIAIALPLAYLVMRTASIESSELWELVSRRRTLQVLFNSAAMAVIVTLSCAAIAIPLAFLTLRTDLKWRRFWLIATTLPLAVPSYVGSFTLLSAFSPKGSLLQLLVEPLGVKELPSIYGWTGTILAMTLFTYPYLLLSVRAGLQGIDPALEEAARSLGKTPQQTFWQITLPQLRPALVGGGLLVALYSLRDFGTPSLMQFDAFTRIIYLQYRGSFDRHAAAASALMLVGLILLILWLENRVRTRAKYYSRGSGRFNQGSLRQSHSPHLVKLGFWQLPAQIFCTLVVSLSLVLPIGVTLFWLLRGWSNTEILPSLLPAVLNSVWASGIAALVAILFALPVAILSIRFPSRLSAILERTAYLGFGLPGIVVALSLVFFGANYVPWLYQTIPMLVFAYLVLFLPQAIGTLRSSLLQINPQLEESARILGKSQWSSFCQITLPLLRPGAIAGAMLVFLTAIKELPANLLLAPIGFETLAVQIWKATENVAFADAAAASLTILLVSLGSTLLLLSQEEGRGRDEVRSQKSEVRS